MKGILVVDVESDSRTLISNPRTAMTREETAMMAYNVSCTTMIANGYRFVVWSWIESESGAAENMNGLAYDNARFGSSRFNSLINSSDVELSPVVNKFAQFGQR